MTVDLETWIVDTGDSIVKKLHRDGPDSLTAFESAVYWMWTIDYAVRNSGGFGPLEDMKSTAIHDLYTFGKKEELLKLTSWLESAMDELAFCESYYRQFDVGCGELREAYDKHDVSLH